jgi:HNH endonuclease
MTALTAAHVIPESLGGKLHALFLCKQCNSDMGRVEGLLPKDPTVLDLVDRLYDVLPRDLANSIYRHAGYFADSEEFGRVDARLDEDLAVTPRESESLLGERNTSRLIEATLRRDGADDAAVKAKLADFAAAPDGARLQVGSDLTVVKGVPMDTFDWKRTYHEDIVPRVVPLGIAYLYLALCIGGHIYGSALNATRTELRRGMAGDETLEKELTFEPKRGEPAEARHALAVTQVASGAEVRIFLFRELDWTVPFPGVALRGFEPFYVIDLVTGEEVI